MTKEAEKEKMIRKKRRSGFLVVAIFAIMGSVLLLAASVLAATAVPETDLTLSVENLIAKYSGTKGDGPKSASDLTVTGSGTTIKAFVKTGKGGSTFSPSYNESTANITLTNGFESDAELSFDVSTSTFKSSGTVTVTVDGVAKDKPYTFTLKGKQSVNVRISSNANTMGVSMGIEAIIDITKFQKIEKKSPRT